jgi:uncharacterized protein (DUF433 family)
MTDYPRITINPKVMTGKPCIRGMRITVGMIAGQIRAGVTTDELLSDFPSLESEDIEEALAYADEHMQPRPCPCCGEKTITFEGRHEECELCNWIDDPTQRAAPTLSGPFNAVSLAEAKAIVAKGQKLPLPEGVKIIDLN